MSIATRIASLRKAKGLTQEAFANAIGLHVTQVKRYEAGGSLPSIEAIKKISKALRIPTDVLIFDEDEIDLPEDLKLQFHAIKEWPPEERAVIKQLLEGMILKHEANRWASISK